MLKFFISQVKSDLSEPPTAEQLPSSYCSFAQIMQKQDNLITNLGAYFYYRRLKQTTLPPTEHYDQILNILIIKIKSSVHEFYGISPEDFDKDQEYILAHLEQHSLKNGCVIDLTLQEATRAYSVSL